MKLSRKFFVASALLIIVIFAISWHPYMKFDENREYAVIFRSNGHNYTNILSWIYRSDCLIDSVNSLKNYSSNNKFQNGIPKLLHYVSNEEDISKTHTDLYKNCGLLNKDVRIVHWTDASFYRVFITEFDSDIVAKWKFVFANLDDPLRTTMMRVMVLFLFGGVSLSLDTVCKKPIREIITNETCFVSVSNTIRANIEFNRSVNFGESVIGCKRNHGFLLSLIKNKKKLDFNSFYLTEYVLLYRKTNDELKVDELNPKISKQMLPIAEMEKICSKNPSEINRINGCKLLRLEKPTNKSSSMLIHQPIYGQSKISIVANDVCAINLPIHIVIF